MNFQVTKRFLFQYGIKAFGIAFLTTFMALSVGCAKQSKTGYWQLSKQSIKQLRANYRHALRKDGVRVIQQGETVKMIFPSDQMFSVVSANLNSSYRETLNLAAKLIKTYQIVSIKVAAYSDNVRRVKNPSNFKKVITTRQAEVVSNYLYERGINTRLIYAAGYGDHDPIAKNTTAAGRSLNRRIEVSFRFYPRPYKNYQ